MKKIIAGLLMAAFSLSAYSGINGLTYHSRANCVNNETITWDLTRRWWMTTTSYHDNPWTGERHPLPDGDSTFEFTWRSASVHWGEAYPLEPKWNVSGWHVVGDKLDEVKLVAYTWAKDCNVYEGWWEHDKPEND